MERWCWKLGREQCEYSYSDTLTYFHVKGHALTVSRTPSFNHSNKHSARRAQTVLNAMEKLVSHKKTEVRPDLDCYKYVLIAMSRSKVPDVGANVIDLFNTMEEDRIFPDTACFDAAIETFKNCSRRAKLEESETYANAAEMMLKRMEREHDRSSVSAVLPSSTTYTNVILALAVRKTQKAAITADGSKPLRPKMLKSKNEEKKK